MQLIGAAPPSKTTSIVLQTRAGGSVGNLQHHALSGFERLGLDATLQQYPFVTVRVRCSPVYNCHGLTFAARRTGIHEGAELRRILNDDGYARVADMAVLGGDVVLYVDDDGDIEHSGIVVERGTSPLFHKVCSKWGKGPEVVHTVAGSPYTTKHLEFHRVAC